MKVSVRLVDPLWRQVNAKEITLELPEPGTVGDMLQTLKDSYPALKSYLLADEVPLTIIIADELVGPDTQLANGASGDRPGAHA